MDTVLDDENEKMPSNVTSKDRLTFGSTSKDEILSAYAPTWMKEIGTDQTVIPALAKDSKKLASVDQILSALPTVHEFFRADATAMTFLKPESVQLVLTSPPYWTLKKYRDHDAQLGDVDDYETFLKALDRVWRKCYRVLSPGGRLVVVVGDVCLSRRKNNGRHMVVPLHASIQEHCRKIGYDNLAPIIWHKIANIQLEASRSSSFLGKPYEPNAVIKNDIEFILMERKSGGYRSPSMLERAYSVISNANHKLWFNQIWTGVTGASTREHPAPFPMELATRLIRMFSFVGDTVLDPFNGSGTTSIAAWRTGRNSIGVEVDDQYLDKAVKRFHAAADQLTSNHEVTLRR
jgi:DNA modification methylase